MEKLSPEAYTNLVKELVRLLQEGPTYNGISLQVTENQRLESLRLSSKQLVVLDSIK